ncbi:hypothetical protein [Cellulomonas sp. KRMCY2]|uniref:hypothetical protein n=1 Tax=Cellulomonas sp. KRMCY2 TaxID=1304865 RepID=UPI0012DF4440|nr:hypothetical protein [Cellulomonas sp. KRMCY2]
MLGLAAVASEVAVVAALEREAEAFKSSGGSVLTVVAPGQIDGDRCESLSKVPGVRAAGAVTVPSDQRITAVALPGAPLPYGYATSGFATVLRVETDGGPGLLLSSDAAQLLGAYIGSDLRTTGGTTRVSGVYEYPRDGRRNGFGYMALAQVDSAQAFDECWADAWPQNPALRSLLLTVVLRGNPSGDEQPEVAPLNLTHGLEFDGNTNYRQRITRWAGVALGTLTAMVGFITLRARRVELASALHDRMSRLDLAAIAFFEALTWTAPPVLFTMVASTTYFAREGELHVGVVLGARIAALIIAGAIVGVGVALLTTRERDLFLYAKDR